MTKKIEAIVILFLLMGCAVAADKYDKDVLTIMFSCLVALHMYDEAKGE